MRIIEVGRASAVVKSLGPSVLHQVLTARYPSTVPAGWRTVHDGGITARVPSDWSTGHVRVTRTRRLLAIANQPGFCGAPIFTAPAFVVGNYTGTESCPSRPAPPPFDERGALTDGLWVHRSTTAQGASRPPDEVGRVSIGRLDLQLGYRAYGATTVTLAIRFGDHVVDVVVGLGHDPAVAEEILSSLRAPASAVPVAPSAPL